MIPGDRETTRSEGLKHLQSVWNTVFATDVDLNSKLEELFSLETDGFSMESAFLSRIDRETDTERFNVVHKPDEVLQEGNTVPLSHTYCRQTIETPSGTMAIAAASAEGWTDDPAYKRFGFESYLGTTVTLEEELYGTLCFVDTEPRTDEISAEERTRLEIYADWVSYEFDQWAGPPRDAPADGAVDVSPITSSEIDSMMDALRQEPRRQVLLALLDGPTVSLRTLERRLGGDRPGVRLHHLYLPKLSEHGYIGWSAGSEIVSRGPKFPEVEPLLRLLDEYPR